MTNKKTQIQDFNEVQEMATTETSKIINRLMKVLKNYGLTAEQINEIIIAITEQ